MKKYHAILFDLDGTLLPMDNDLFIQRYFHLLAEALAVHGYTEAQLTPALWKGVGAMVKNDGARPNADAFWQVFAGLLGQDILAHTADFDRFYRTDFHKARELTFPTPLSAELVAEARRQADRVILATNPLFPRVAIEARLSWARIDPTAFDHITDYENSSTCKPNPAYYAQLLNRFGLKAENCLMVGNNAQEDVEAAAACGIPSYLVTDWLICKGELPDCPNGSLEALLQFLKEE